MRRCGRGSCDDVTLVGGDSQDSYMTYEQHMCIMEHKIIGKFIKFRLLYSLAAYMFVYHLTLFNLWWLPAEGCRGQAAGGRATRAGPESWPEATARVSITPSRVFLSDEVAV